MPGRTRLAGHKEAALSRRRAGSGGLGCRSQWHEVGPTFCEWVRGPSFWASDAWEDDLAFCTASGGVLFSFLLLRLEAYLA